MEIVKKNYDVLDICKFLLAILLVIAHTASEKIELPGILDRLCSLYVIVVPFFFMTSGFLFFKKLIECNTEEEKKQRYKKYTKRILMMYLIWSIIYCCFNIAYWCKEGTTLSEVAIYVYKSVTYASYPTIWFLPALWIGVSIVYFLKKWNFSTNIILVIGTCTYFVGWFGYTFSSSFEWLSIFTDVFKTIFSSYRNGVMYALVFAAMGLKLAEDKTDNILFKDVALSVVFCVVFVSEAFVSNGYFKVDANYLLGLIPFTYFFVRTILNISLRKNNRGIYVFCRNMSLLIFLSQRIFITALPKLFPEYANSIFENWVVGLFTIIICTVSFSYLVIKMSPKIKILNYLWH